jgi:hypothetical protein
MRVTPLLEGRAQPLQDVAAALRQFVHKQNRVVRLRHVARQRHLPAADQPDIGEGVMRGAAIYSGHKAESGW